MDTKALIDALEDAGYEWRPYSGRGMYGKSCVGVVIDEARYLFEMGATLEGDIDIPRIDQMGLQVIAYWPSAKVEDEQQEPAA